MINDDVLYKTAKRQLFQLKTEIQAFLNYFALYNQASDNDYNAKS